jgi:hypothetical protein
MITQGNIKTTKDHMLCIFLLVVSSTLGRYISLSTPLILMNTSFRLYLDLSYDMCLLKDESYLATMCILDCCL